MRQTLAVAGLAEQVSVLGIRYHFRHGTEWTCRAVWLRHEVAHALSPEKGRAMAPPASNDAGDTVLDGITSGRVVYEPRSIADQVGVLTAT